MEPVAAKAFRIESVGYCPSGVAPRWTWWLHGVAGTARYGMVGTDEAGQGLYLFQHTGDAMPAREPLLCPDTFCVPEQCSTGDATALLARALEAMGWGHFDASRPKATHSIDRHGRTQ